MKLNPFDDYPYHQGFTPLHIPATSDPHYNDGYWFAWYQADKYFFLGMRVHPNNNVLDGYGGAVVGNEQRDVRASRALLPRHGDLSVGPVALEILEPMQRQRVTLSENPTGITFEITVTASAPMVLEEPHIQYRFGRVLNHLMRYSGAVRAQGTATIDGEAIVVDNWFGARDHSWGIRSTMGPYVPIGGVPETDRGDPRAIRIWIPFEVDDHVGFFHTHETATGRALDFQGALFWKDGRPQTDLVDVRHSFEYHPGTRRLAGGTFVLIDQDGKEHSYEFSVAAHPVHPQGFGYTRGWNDGGQIGVYRGLEHLEHDRFDVSDPTQTLGPEHVPVERRLGGTEFSSELTGPGGAKGMAMVEHMIYGRYDPYGFHGK